MMAQMLAHSSSVRIIREKLHRFEAVIEVRPEEIDPRMHTNEHE